MKLFIDCARTQNEYYLSWIWLSNTLGDVYICALGIVLFNIDVQIIKVTVSIRYATSPIKVSGSTKIWLLARMCEIYKP